MFSLQLLKNIQSKILLAKCFIALVVLLSHTSAYSKSIHTSAIQYVPDSIDPVLAGDTNAQFIVTNCFDGLVNWTLERGLEPKLAKSWVFSEDKKKISFSLREDLVFSDKTAFESKYVKAHFERLMKSKLFASHFKNIKSIKIVNQYVVEFQLKSQSNHFLHLISGSHARIVKKNKEEITGIGPFIPKFEKEKIVLNKNFNYWAQKASVDSVVLLAMSSELALQKLKAGEIDDMILHPGLTQVNEKSIKSMSQNMWATWAIIFDQRVGPFNNIEIRQQLVSRLRSETFIKLFPGNVEAFGIQAFGMPGWLSSEIKFKQSNIKKWNHKKLSINIFLPEEVERLDEIGQWIDQQMSDSQINNCCSVKTKSIPFVEIMSSYGKGNRGAMLLSLNPEYPDPTFLIRSIHSKSSSNFLGIKDRSLDKLINELDLASSDVEMAKLMGSINSILMNKAALVPLMHIVHKALFRDCVSGLKLNPVSEGYFSLREVKNECN